MIGRTYLTLVNMSAKASAITRLSAKGQVVIPHAVRSRLAWREGDELEVIDRPDGVELRLVRRARRKITLDELYARVPPHTGPPLTLEDMDRALDDAALEWLERDRLHARSV